MARPGRVDGVRPPRMNSDAPNHKTPLRDSEGQEDSYGSGDYDGGANERAEHGDGEDVVETVIKEDWMSKEKAEIWISTNLNRQDLVVIDSKQK